MADLRATLTAAGFGDVRTHLQSGNIVLASDLTGASLGEKLASVLAGELGVTTDVIVRSVDELAAAMAADPFGALATDPARHVLGFCSAVPDPEQINDVERRIAEATRKIAEKDGADVPSGDRHTFAGQHFYLWCPNGISASPYFAVPWDRLGVAVTQRNWNTVTALLQLAR